MADNQQLKINDPSIAPLVESSKKLDDHRWLVTLKDGSTIVIDDQGDRIKEDVSTPYGIHETVTMDDVGDYAHAKASSGMTVAADDKGARSDWDIKSIGDAETWLRSHADTLSHLWHGMNDISDLMKGPDGNTSSLGTFNWANTLTRQHDAVFTGVHDGLKNVIESLYDAADAVKTVAANYKSAEERNQMTTAQMEKIFTDEGQQTHNF
jgi:hypothetical protein